MATITTSTLGELLKRLYASWEIQQLVNLTHPALDSCARKGSAQLGGTGFFFPVRTESAHGHAYISENADLPAGRQTTVKQAVVSPTVHAGVVQLTGLSMAVSSGNAMSFARSFDENVQQTIAAMSTYKEGAMFRDGSGVISTFGASPNGVAAGTAVNVTDVSHFRPGMVLDFIDDSDNTRHNTDVEVTEVDWVNKTLKFDTATAAGLAAGDRLYIADSQAASGALQSLEPIGVEGSIRNSNTYLGLDRTAAGNSTWQAEELTANSFFDESLLLRGRTRITQNSGIPFTSMGGSFKCLTHPMQVDNLFKLAIPRIRYSGGDSFDLGNHDNVSFGGIQFVTSYQAPADKAYLGDFQFHVTLFTPNGELHVDTEYNGSALKWVATKDVGLVFLKEYCAFALQKPICFLRYDSLTEQSR